MPFLQNYGIAVKKIRIPAFLSSGKIFTVVPERECKIYFFINYCYLYEKKSKNTT